MTFSRSIWLSPCNSVFTSRINESLRLSASIIKRITLSISLLKTHISPSPAAHARRDKTRNRPWRVPNTATRIFRINYHSQPGHNNLGLKERQKYN